MKKIQFNIKKKMMSMALIAILIPLLSVSVFSKLYYEEIIKQKRNDEIEAQAEYAAMIAKERVEGAIKLSQDMTYEGNIEHYAKLLEQGKINERLAYNYITEALKDKFYLKKEILFSAVLLECNPSQVYSITADGRYRIADYLTYVHPLIEETVKDLGNGIAFRVYEDKIYIIRNLISIKNFKKYGIIINELDTPSFFREFVNHTYLQECVTITLNEQEVDLGVYDEEELRKKGKVIAFTEEVVSEHFKMGYAIKIVAKHMMAEELALMKGISIGIGSIAVLLTLLICWFYRSITNPIEMLMKAFKKVEEGELGVVVHYTKQDELGFLIQGFNDMSTQTKYLVDCVYKEELALKEAKIKALQSQINPHFINNTLEIINWKAQLIGGREISKMIRALSDIMNASSSRNDQKMVLLYEEINYMNAYLYILEKRFEERIYISKEIDETLGACEVPLLIIQPLLENAIVHGIEPAKGGKVHIHIYEKEALIHIEISNDGKPLDEETEAFVKRLLSGQEVPKKQHSVGIRNVNERIKLIYGERYGLSIGKNEQGMTSSIVRIPYNCTTNSNKQHGSLVKKASI